jgi:hypothetical protein
MYEPRSMKSVMAAFRVQMAISEIAIAVGILTLVPESVVPITGWLELAIFRLVPYLLFLDGLNRFRTGIKKEIYEEMAKQKG